MQVFRNQPEVDLDDDPTWTQDPMASKTWRLYYHGLTWLLAPAWGALHGIHRRRTRHVVRNILESYMATNVFQAARDPMAWDDHATADRLATICWLVDRIPWLSRAIGPDRLDAAIDAHIQKLLEFYESRRWIDSNHGLFHALALLDARIVFPHLPRAEDAVEVGRQYLAEVVSNLVDPDDGISTEQSLHYHQFAIRVFRSMRLFLDYHHSDIAPLVDRALEGMVDFNLCIAGRNRSMPAIGDTRVFDYIPADTLVFGENERTLARSPGDPLGPNNTSRQLIVFRRSGYALFRHLDRRDSNVSRATMVAHPERVSHGHFDALSVTLQLRGTDVLIDSGGPYAYGDFLRFGYFVASRAHNVVLIDDTDHQAPGELTAQGSHNGLSWVSGRHSGYPGRTVVRTVIWHPGVTFVVFDLATEADSATFDGLWHFPPGTELATQHNSEIVATRIDVDHQTFFAQATATTSLKFRVVEGVLEPKPQGWITTRLEEKQPAPVQIVTAEGPGLQMVTSFSVDQGVVLRRRGETVEAELGASVVGVGIDGVPHFRNVR